jgi:hypothetical protein
MTVLYSTDLAPDLTGTCTSNGVGANLTGVTLIQLKLKKPSGTVVIKTGTLVTPSVGTWSYSWLAGDLDEDGTWWVQARVTYSNGKTQTFPEAAFAVGKQFA